MSTDYMELLFPMWDGITDDNGLDTNGDGLMDQTMFFVQDDDYEHNYPTKHSREVVNDVNKISPGIDSGHCSLASDLFGESAGIDFPGTYQSGSSQFNRIGQPNRSPAPQGIRIPSMRATNLSQTHPTGPGHHEQTPNLLSPTNICLKRSFQDNPMSYMKKGKRAEQDVPTSPTKPRVITATSLPKADTYGNCFIQNQTLNSFLGLSGVPKPGAGESRDISRKTISHPNNPRQGVSQVVTSCVAPKTEGQGDGQGRNAVLGQTQQNYMAGAAGILIKLEERQQTTKCSPEVNQSLQVHLKLQNGGSVPEGHGLQDSKFKGDNSDQPVKPSDFISSDNTHKPMELFEEEEKKKRQQMKNRQYAKESRDRKNKKMETLEIENREKDVEIEILRKCLNILYLKNKGTELNWKFQTTDWYIKQPSRGQGHISLRLLLPADQDIWKELGNSHFGVVIPTPSGPVDVTGGAKNDQVKKNDVPIVQEVIPEKMTTVCRSVSHDLNMSDQKDPVSNVPTFLAQGEMVSKHRGTMTSLPGTNLFTSGPSTGNHCVSHSSMTSHSSMSSHIQHRSSRMSSSAQHVTINDVTGCLTNDEVVGLFGSSIHFSPTSRTESREINDVSPWCTQFKDDQGQGPLDSGYSCLSQRESYVLDSNLEEGLSSEVFNLSTMDMDFELIASEANAEDS